MTEEPKHETTAPDDKARTRAYEKDPYPKMIIVCIIITFFLLLLIGAVMMIDFVVKPQEVEGFEHFEVPGDGAMLQQDGLRHPISAPIPLLCLHQHSGIV